MPRRYCRVCRNRPCVSFTPLPSSILQLLPTDNGIPAGYKDKWICSPCARKLRGCPTSHEKRGMILGIQRASAELRVPSKVGRPRNPVAKKIGVEISVTSSVGVGSIGAGVGSIGVGAGSIGAGVGSIGAGVGSTSAGVGTSTNGVDASNIGAETSDIGVETSNIRIKDGLRSVSSIIVRPGLSKALESNVVRGNIIGFGGTAKVYKGTYNQQPVAIKSFYTNCKEFLALELDVFKNLGPSDFVAEVIGNTTDELVLRYYGLGSLFDVIQSSPAAVKDVKAIAVGIATGMEYVHGKGLIHGDLNTKNILMETLTHPRIADFGVTPTATARNGALWFGTDRWRAPEIMRYGAGRYSRVSGEWTEKIDVYSFGIVLWELCHLQVPYTGMDYSERDVRKNQKFRPAVTKGLQWQGLMQRCWDQDANNRPSFGEIVRELQNKQ